MFDGPSWQALFKGFEIVFAFGPIWMPIVFTFAAWQQWIGYRRARYIERQQYQVLEVRVPAEVRKTPAAMEAVFDALHLRPGESTFLKRLFEGAVRPWFSFELVSFEGQVHFYIWTRAGFRRHIERAFYAQYPEVEIVPVEDYAARFPFSIEEFELWGCDFKLGKPDPFPIKTYVDFELDKSITKEEEKMDPFATFIEFLGSMGKDEYLWYQFIFRVHKSEPGLPGTPLGITDINARAKAELQKIRQSPAETTYFTDKEYKVLSELQKEQIKGIERKLYKKHHFDVGIRGMYFARKGVFEGTTIGGFLNTFKLFGPPGYNGIGGARYLFDYDYPWEDYHETRQNRQRVRLFDAYRRRSWFHPPYRTPSYVLSGEELATLIHVPGAVVQTPTFERIPSTRREAPANLPI